MISNLPAGATHIGRINAWTVPCYGFKGAFDVFKYDDDVLKVYRTDSDNEYGRWIEVGQLFTSMSPVRLIPLTELEKIEVLYNKST